jgi:hypothetical protein
VKIGDLVRCGSTTPENRTPIQKAVGTVIKDNTMLYCRGAHDERMGRVDVLWPDGSIEDVVFASLEVINED